MNKFGPSFTKKILRFIGRSGLPGTHSLVTRLGGLEPSLSCEFTVDFDSMRYTGSFEEYIDRHIWCFGSYSTNELDFLDCAAKVLRTERRSLTCLDIGANVGQHALFMAKRCDRVLAFEPNSVVADRLQINRDQNNLSNLEIYRVALGLEDGEAMLGSGLPFNSGSRSLTWSLASTQNTKVHVKHAGKYLSAMERNLQKVDIIKLDVEGFEKTVLTAMSEILKRDRPIILFELVGNDVKGGFRSEYELNNTLYDSHQLFGLASGDKGMLVPYRWDDFEEAVCLPIELVSKFHSIIRQ